MITVILVTIVDFGKILTRAEVVELADTLS